MDNIDKLIALAHVKLKKPTKEKVAQMRQRNRLRKVGLALIKEKKISTTQTD